MDKVELRRYQTSPGKGKRLRRSGICPAIHNVPNLQSAHARKRRSWGARSQYESLRRSPVEGQPYSSAQLGWTSIGGQDDITASCSGIEPGHKFEKPMGLVLLQIDERLKPWLEKYSYRWLLFVSSHPATM
jgi:hypothetical protein